jgi:beta-hydroxyacyl-ACP dehydratase FabZ
MAVMEIDEILKYLPHRYPFLLVDRIEESDWETRIVGIKNVTVNEPFFQGHFPGRPVMPGVLQLEAMAQVGGLLLNKKHGLGGTIAFFSSVDNARFRRMIVPGDVLRIEVEFLRARLRTAKVHGAITVGDERSCEADLMFTYADQKQSL